MMSVIIRLQGLPWSASAGDIRTFFHGLNIPDGGVHIVGGERGDAFIAFTSDEDARLAMQCNNAYLKDSPVQLFLSSKTEMQNVIAEARDGHIPRQTVTQPPYVNTSPMAGRPLDEFSRPDAGGRRVPNVPLYGGMGPPDDHQAGGLRGGNRHQPDTLPVSTGRSDDQYQPLDSFPRGSRDNRNGPNMFPSDSRGRDLERPDFPPRFPNEEMYPLQGLPSSRPPMLRDETLDHHPSREIADPSRAQLGSDVRPSQRPLSDLSPASKSYREEPRRGSDRRSISDRGHRDDNRNSRDDHRRSTDRPGTDLSETSLRGSRDRSRRSEENPDHSRSTSRSSSRDTRQESDRERRDRDGRDSRRDLRKDNTDIRRSSSRQDDMSRRDVHGRDKDSRRDVERSDIGRPDISRPDRLAGSRSEIYRSDIGRPDVERPDLGITDMSRPDQSRSDMSKSDLGRPDRGRLDMGRPTIGRSDMGRPDMGRLDIGRSEMARPDMGRPDKGRPDMGRPDMGRPDMGRPDKGRPDMGRPDIVRPDMGRPDMGRPDMGRLDKGRPDIGRPAIGRPDMGRPDIGRPDMSRPDMGRPDMSRPDMGRPDIGRPDMGRPDMSRSDMGRPDIGRPDMGRLDMARPDMNRPQMVRPNLGRPDMARSDMGRPDIERQGIGRQDLGRRDVSTPDHGRLDLRPDLGRPDIDRPEMRRPDMGRRDTIRLETDRPDSGRSDLNRLDRSDISRPDMGRPDRGRSDRGRPDLGRPDRNRDYAHYPHSDRERPGHEIDELTPLSGPDNLAQRNGLRQGQDRSHSNLNKFGDQDRRGPPPRFPGDRGPPASERVPLMQTQRGMPNRDSGRGNPGFPQDQDTRVTPVFGKLTDGSSVSLSQPPLNMSDGIQNQGPGERFPGPSQMRSTSVDWDNRGPRDVPMPPPLLGMTFPKPSNERNTLTTEPAAEENFSSLRGNPRTLLPDPILPRREGINDQDARNDSYNRQMEYDRSFNSRDGPFDRGFGNGFQENIDLRDRRSSPQLGPYPPRGPPGSLSMPMRPGPPGPPEFYLKIRNMPLSITYSSLRRFFGSLFIPRDGIKLINNNQGNRNGLGFVKMLSRRELDIALGFDGRLMDGNNLIINPCSFEEFSNAIDSYPCVSRPLSPKRHIVDSDLGHSSPKRKRSEPPSDTPNRFVIMLRDVAYRATAQDLKKYFEQLDIAQNGQAIIADQDSSGKPNGIVFVELTNPNDFHAALKRNYGRILGRVVYVSAADPRDIDRVREKIEKWKKTSQIKEPSENEGSGDSNVITSKNRGISKDSEDRSSGKKPSLTNDPPKAEIKPSQVPAKSNPAKPNDVKPVSAKPVSAKPVSAKPNPVKAIGTKPNPVKQDPGNSCVKVNGLPSGVTKKDVEEFFKGLEISPKGYNPVLRKDGTCTGDAFVEFVNSNDCQKASAKNQQMMKDKKVTVVAVSRTEMETELEELRKKALEEGQNQQANRPPPLYFMLGAQNLPFTVSIGEILNFFRGYNPVPESIRLHYNNEGRATGDAVIGFMTESECHRALRDLNSRMLGRRNIRLFLA